MDSMNSLKLNKTKIIQKKAGKEESTGTDRKSSKLVAR